MLSIDKPYLNSVSIRNVISELPFYSKIKSVSNIAYSIYRMILPHEIDIFKKEISQQDIDYIIENNYPIGFGSYGVVYKIYEFAVKLPQSEESFSTSYSNCYRTSRILNEVNGRDYSRASKLKDGTPILISKYIDGVNVGKKESVNFILSKDRVIHDAHVEGNVLKIKDGTLYLIDADHVTLPINKRKNSIASDDYYSQYKHKI